MDFTMLENLDEKAVAHFQKKAGKEAAHVLNVLAESVEMSEGTEDDRYAPSLRFAALFVNMPYAMVKQALGIFKGMD